MVYGIIGALDEEIALVKEKMTGIEEHILYGRSFYTGRIGQKDVVLVCCGVGKVNAALFANAVIREFEADAVINIGIAGAIGAGIGVMDVVLSTDAVFHDQDEIMVKYYPFCKYFKADETLLSLAKAACEQVPLHGKVTCGRIVTGDQFVNDPAVKFSLRERFDPCCTEMEGAAIAHASYVNDTPFLIIRTMSDSADDGADESYDNFIDTAAHQSAAIVLKMLELA